MPFYGATRTKYRGGKSIEENWDTFRGGLDKFLRPQELEEDEYYDGENLILSGKGKPSPRPGLDTFSTAGGSGLVRSIRGVKFSSGTRELLHYTDAGLLTKNSGASYSIVAGASFSSGLAMQMVMLDDKVWLTTESDSLAYYNGTSLTQFNSLAAPTGASVSLISASASGAFVQSYRITALSDTGETLGSTAALATGLSSRLTDSSLYLKWAAVSAASGDLTGYAVYGREPGKELYLATVPNESTSWVDDGTITPNVFTELPLANSTAGITARYMINHKGSLVCGYVDSERSRVAWSGGGQNVGKFHWSVGGGFVDVNRDSGEDLTGLADAFDKVVVFFEGSIYTVDLSESTTFLGVSVPTPTIQKISSSVGCIGQQAIAQVENDLFFVSRKPGGGVALMAMGYEPNITSPVLRVNEISLSVRPIFESIAEDQISKIHIKYKNGLLYVAYPEANEGQPNKVISFDRERLCWNPPHTIGTNAMELFIDSDNKDRFLLASNSGVTIYEQKDSLHSDFGAAFRSYFRSRDTHFGTPHLFAELKNVFVDLSNVKGSLTITVSVLDNNGSVVSAKSASVSNTPSTVGVGFGYDAFGSINFGDTAGLGSSQTVNDLIRWLVVNTMGRYFRVEIESNSSSSYWELSSIRLEATEQSKGYLSQNIQV